MEYVGQNGYVIWALPKPKTSKTNTDQNTTLSQWNYRGTAPKALSTHDIPKNAIGFTYCLSGAGGGGGAGGLTCGGGGGGTSDFVEDRILFADLIQQIGVPLEELSIESQLGTIGRGGVGLNALGFGNSGEVGGESKLIIHAAGLDPSSIVLAVAKGGFGALGGTAFHGFGFGEFGTTYTGDGGMGELVEKNDHRSRDGPDRWSSGLNHYGDGGNGGAIGSPGLPGKPAYFSIEFF